MSDFTDKRYQRKHNISLLESYLDNGTILKVIEHLDSYSIINFLHAFPSFKNWAVIVTDHHKPQPLFFRIDGVERVHITDYTESLPVEVMADDGDPDYLTLAKSNLRVQRFTTSRPIRLFEFAWMDTEEYMDSILPVIPSQEKLSLDQPFYFNATSFVFLCPNYYRDIRPMDALTRRLDEFTEAKWHVGWSPYFNDECVIMNNALSLHATNVELIKNLYLKDVSVLENLHLPELQRLSLIYHDTTAPVVRGIVAPKLNKLIVHYSHALPQFSEMSVAMEERNELEHSDIYDSMYAPHEYYYLPEFEDRDDLKVFELAHIGGMTKGTLTLQHTSDQRKNDFSFLSQFEIVHLFGVPDTFFHSADLSKIWKLRWDIVDQPHLVRPIGYLGSLSLVVRHDGISVPSFRMKIPKFYSGDIDWHIMILGLDTQTSNLWCSDFVEGYGFRFNSLCIYSSPRLIKRDSRSVLELGYDDWGLVSSLMMDTYDLPVIKRIELIGFKMPFLSHKPGLDVQERLHWGSYHAKKFILRPVIDIQSEGEHLELRTIFLSYGMWEDQISRHNIRAVDPSSRIQNLHFAISPFVVNRERGTRNTLEVCYPHHIGDLLIGLPYEVSRTFSISLGEGVSSLCLLNAKLTSPLVLDPEQESTETIHIDLNSLEPGTQLVGRLRRGRDMGRDWFFYAE